MNDPAGHIEDDIAARIPGRNSPETAATAPFGYSNRSLMGEMQSFNSPVNTHDHPIAERHVRHFAELVGRNRPGRLGGSSAAVPTAQGGRSSWARSGGRPPADDERLAIDDDGAFTARRTVGGARIGAFAGTLEAATLEAVRREAAAGREAGELWLETPRDGATESIAFADDEEPAASLGSNAQPVGPWADLVTRLRGLTQVTAHPAAALELVGDAAGARLVAVGDGALDVDTASVSVRVVRLDAAGAMLGRWQAPSEATSK